MLALRSYLRNGHDIDVRWSWAGADRRFRGLAEQRDLSQEIERVRRIFTASNPDFELYMNPQERSLDIQIEHWNCNRFVAAAAEAMLA